MMAPKRKHVGNRRKSLPDKQLSRKCLSASKWMIRKRSLRTRKSKMRCRERSKKRKKTENARKPSFKDKEMLRKPSVRRNKLLRNRTSPITLSEMVSRSVEGQHRCNSKTKTMMFLNP